MDQEKLIGKTIQAVVHKKRSEYDDLFIEITFTDGSKVIFEPMYDGFTGDSVGEYPKYILLHDNYDKELKDL